MLSQDQVAFYRQNGYVLVPGLLSAEEAATLRRECHELAERLSRHQNIDATWGSARQAVDGAADTRVLHCHNVQFYSAAPCPARAGDVLFFSYLTIHGSGLNTSKEARTTLLVQMRDPEDPPTAKVHESRGQGMMLRGVDPIALPRGVS